MSDTAQRHGKMKSGSCSLESLCGSVVEHRSAEFEGLRFDPSWGLRIFSLSHALNKTVKHLSLFLWRVEPILIPIKNMKSVYELPTGQVSRKVHHYTCIVLG